MGEQLFDENVLLGKTKQEILEMLGEPAPKGFPYGAVGWDLVYQLGPEHGFFSIDDEWLMLRLNNEGRVFDQSLYTD
jgi:hypothetical protein